GDAACAGGVGVAIAPTAYHALGEAAHAGDLRGAADTLDQQTDAVRESATGALGGRLLHAHEDGQVRKEVGQAGSQVNSSGVRQKHGGGFGRDILRLLSASCQVIDTDAGIHHVPPFASHSGTVGRRVR